MMGKRVKPADRREQIRKEYFSGLDVWTGEDDGWFKAPRTLPLILALLKQLKVKSAKGKGGSIDLSSTYLELWSRHHGQGVIEMGLEGDHAFCAGYVGERAVRTWQERMKYLIELGFIKAVEVGNVRYRFVALIHPAEVLAKLDRAGSLEQKWLYAYKARILETKEPSFEQREKDKEEAAKPLDFHFDPSQIAALIGKRRPRRAAAAAAAAAQTPTEPAKS